MKHYTIQRISKEVDICKEHALKIWSITSIIFMHTYKMKKQQHENEHANHI
jgi:hypothetical protein